VAYTTSFNIFLDARRSFEALRVLRVFRPPEESENHSRHEGLHVGLPACTTLELIFCPIEYHRCLSCPNVQNLYRSPRLSQTFDLAAFNSFHDFLLNLSCLQNIDISVPQGLGIESLNDFVLCGASERGVWRDIRSVEVDIWFNSSSEASDFFDQTVGHQPRYEEWWKSFTVTRRFAKIIIIKASM